MSFALTVDNSASSQVAALLAAASKLPVTVSSGAELALIVGSERLTTLVDIAKKLDLYGDDATTKKWIQYKDDELTPVASSKDVKQLMPVLVKLSKALENQVFLANNVISLADLALFVAAAPVFKTLSDEDRTRFDNFTRWFDHIQHLRSLSKKVAEFGLNVEISQKVAEPKKEEPKKEEPKKQEAKKPEGEKKTQEKKEKQPAKEAAPAAESKDAAAVDLRVSRLDLRVGKIVNVQRHPGADSLYQEDIDLGEEKPRQVVSGLVKFVPIEEMKDRLVLVLCNLKAANMRGVRSEGMVIAASNDDHTQVQLVDIPAGSKVGERVFVKGHEDGKPDGTINLSNKDNIFKSLQEHLRTNDKGVAVFKDAPLATSAGELTVKSQFNAHLG